MNGRQQAAVTHLQMVGRDIHRFVVLAREHGLPEEDIKQAIADGVAMAEKEEEAQHGGRVPALREAHSRLR